MTDTEQVATGSLMIPVCVCKILEQDNRLMARSSGARALEHCRRRYAITIAIAKFRDSRLTHGQTPVLSR
jgi:hypothetical protein